VIVLGFWLNDDLFSSESSIDQSFSALHSFIELLAFFAEICLATAVFRVYIF